MYFIYYDMLQLFSTFSSILYYFDGGKSPDNLSVKILFPSLLCVATIILFISPILFIKLSHVYPNNCFVISPIHRSLSVAYDFCL